MPHANGGVLSLEAEMQLLQFFSFQDMLSVEEVQFLARQVSEATMSGSIVCADEIAPLLRNDFNAEIQNLVAINIYCSIADMCFTTNFLVVCIR